MRKASNLQQYSVLQNNTLEVVFHSAIELVSYLETVTDNFSSQKKKQKKNTILTEEHRRRSTFHGQQIIYGQFQTLAPPEHTNCVPLIIVHILTRKNSLWTFACRTVQTVVNTHACIHTTYITQRLGDGKEDRSDKSRSLTEAENIKINIVNGP